MANRKTRRNEKRKYNIDYSKINDESSSNSIKIGVIVVAIFIAFYLLTMFLTNNVNLDNNNNNNNDNDTNTPASIQYDEILVGETFKMNNSEYYVLMYDFSDTSSSIYETFISDYKANSTGIKLYTVDLAKGFNTSYISENSNPSTSNIDDLKVKGPTLIKISNGINVLNAEGKDAIKNALK